MYLRFCYSLIQSYQELEKFVNFLPEDNHGEQYYITLFARKKYDTSGLLKCDKNCIKRLTARKQDIIQKIQQLEAPLDTYTYNGVPIPEECLAVYISANPRSFHKAAVGMIKELAALLGEGKVTKNVKSIALNHLQTCSESKNFFDIDIDFLGPEDYDEFRKTVSGFINLDCTRFVRTRGGYHCLVKLDAIKPEYSKSWYQNFANLKFKNVSIMMNSDGLLPIPGTSQGGFIPTLQD